MRRVFTAAALALGLAGGLAGAAFAGSCPKDMAEIDAALAKSPALSADQMSEVTKLRAEGEALHKAGKHKESVDALHKAKGILGLM